MFNELHLGFYEYYLLNDAFIFSFVSKTITKKLGVSIEHWAYGRPIQHGQPGERQREKVKDAILLISAKNVLNRQVRYLECPNIFRKGSTVVDTR